VSEKDAMNEPDAAVRTDAFFRDYAAAMEAQPALAAGGTATVVQGSKPHNRADPLRGDVDLEDLTAESPGSGWGSAFMILLCDLADRHALKLFVEALSPSEYEEDFDEDDARPGQVALTRFYSKFGFRLYPGFSHDYLVRAPAALDAGAEARLSDALGGRPVWANPSAGNAP
jgi:hypothetical protein